MVLDRGQGVHVFDVEGKMYYDFLSAYSAVNQGHCHPKILKTFIEQASKVTLTSRAFYNSNLGECEKFLAETFNYEKVLLMNSGCEAGESAIKFARRWAYNVKRVPEDQAKVVLNSFLRAKKRVSIKNTHKGGWDKCENKKKKMEKVID